MTENEKEIETCHHCDEEASEIIYRDNGEEEMVCDSCEDSEYFTCPDYGTVHKISDGWELEGELYSYDGYHDNAITCEWSGDEIHRDNAYCVNGDYYIREDYSDDVSCCNECGHEGHYEDFEWNDRHDGYFCYDCNPTNGHEWYGNFRKITPIGTKTKRNEVKNYVGIEFEIENAGDGPSQDEMPEFAMCEPDGSLRYDGLEYKTHVMFGSQVKDVIDKFCGIIRSRGMSAGDSTIGWHFHYSLEDRENGHIRNLSHSFADFGDMVQHVDGYNYFRNMLRNYACPLPLRYKNALREYDGKTSLYNHITQGYGHPPRGCMINLTRLLRRGSEKGNEQRRVEIRMYSPRSFLMDLETFYPNANSWDRHKLLAEDYHNFILFWDEFMRKSAVRRLETRNGNGNLMNLRQFSRQFSPKVRNWLRSRENAKVMPHPQLGTQIDRIRNEDYINGSDELYGSVNSRTI